MAKLNRNDGLALLQLFVKAQNNVKGEALDLIKFRIQGEQVKIFEKRIKDREQYVRKIFHDALVNGEIIEAVRPEELSRMK